MQEDERGIFKRGREYIKSYFNVPSLLLFSIGAALGFVVGSTGKISGDFFDFTYNSGRYLLSNFPNYDFSNSIVYATNALTSAIPRAVEEGSRAAPIYGLGTLFFGKIVKSKLSSFFRER